MYLKAATQLAGEESRPAKNSKRVKGKFLRKSKGKISQKGEKRKRKMEKF